MRPSTILTIERVARPIVTALPGSLLIAISSFGRKKFLESFEKENPDSYFPPEELERVLWGIRFRGPLINAAGMFKNGEAYDVVVKQGAAGYIGGTTTYNQRDGKTWKGIDLPFVNLPNSGIGINALSLPNEGYLKTMQKIPEIKNYLRLYSRGYLGRPECPLGWSVGYDSNTESDEQRMNQVLQMLKSYDVLGVDFLEIDESCPNTPLEKSKLEERLRHIGGTFLKDRSDRVSARYMEFKRERSVPVIVKLSNDTGLEKIPHIMNILIESGFDGVNFGNTSTNYRKHRKNLSRGDKRIYDKFTEEIGGGVSGRVLKGDSLELCAEASRHIKARNIGREFHIIRTGGIETYKDILESDAAGVSLNQWFTGYWESFRRDGHEVYRRLHGDLLENQ